MTRRWRSGLLLWLALSLPLQGFAAASGLWCAKLGFHAPAWMQAAGHAEAGHGAVPAAPPRAQADGTTASTCHEAMAEAETLAAGPPDEPGPASAQPADAPRAPHACAQCAGCHASAALPAPPAVGAPEPSTLVPAGWTATPHAGPWLQGFERPPRPRLA